MSQLMIGVLSAVVWVTMARRLARKQGRSLGRAPVLALFLGPIGVYMQHRRGENNAYNAETGIFPLMGGDFDASVERMRMLLIG